MSGADKDAATLPPPPPVANEQTELILAELRSMNANLRLVANVVKEHGTAIEEIDRNVKAIRQQTEGAAEASASALDVATEVKVAIRDSLPPARTLREVCEAADEKAGIAMDVATRVAERFGVREIVDQVEEEHADRAEKNRARGSIGPAR